MIGEAMAPAVGLALFSVGRWILGETEMLVDSGWWAQTGASTVALMAALYLFLRPSLRRLLGSWFVTLLKLLGVVLLLGFCWAVVSHGFLRTLLNTAVVVLLSLYIIVQPSVCRDTPDTPRAHAHTRPSPEMGPPPGAPAGSLLSQVLPGQRSVEPLHRLPRSVWRVHRRRQRAYTLVPAGPTLHHR